MKDSWLDPQGNIIEVGDFQHNNYAIKILEKEFDGDESLFDYMEKNNIEYPYCILHKRGWIRIKINTSYLPRICIIGDCIDLTKQMKNTIDPPMNGIQMIVAKRLCKENNTPFLNAINDKRFWI